MIEKVFGSQAVGTLYGDVGKGGFGGERLDLEGEGGGEGGVTIPCVTEKEEVVGLHGIGGEEKIADGDGGEVVGFFEG